MNRRKFLYKLSIGLGALGYLASCNQSEDQRRIPSSTGIKPEPLSDIPYGINETLSPEPSTQMPTEYSSDAATVSEKYSEQPSSIPHLAVVRNGDPASLVQTALAAMGGIERFVPPGSNVIIKPNICVAYHSYEYAATTNPWVVGALVNLCIKAGARVVKVMDSPFGGTAQEAYKRSGIEEQVISSGGQMAIMSRIKFVPMNIPEGINLKSTEIYDEIVSTDVLINVPIAKHHSLARLTLGMKNFLGVIKDRPSIHMNMSQRIADLNSLVRPNLTVIDAVRMLMANGPTGGNLNDVREANTIIASPDIVAADSYAATLFGLRPQDLGYITAATSMNLGRSDIDKLKIEEINLGA